MSRQACFRVQNSVNVAFIKMLGLFVEAVTARNIVVYTSSVLHTALRNSPMAAELAAAEAEAMIAGKNWLSAVEMVGRLR